jgi:tRNA pseudouridine38-40 synthase
MTRWKLTLEYDGTAFCGWQRQAHAPSVQQTIEEALFRLTGETPTLYVAGRTDTGVHAEGQVAHLDLVKEMPLRAMEGGLNFYLRPHKVAVLAAEQVPETFHARFGALTRFYRYTILNRRAPSPLLETRAWHVARPLDDEAMRDAAACLPGKHDFSTFRAAGCQANSPLRTLEALTLRREGNLLHLETSARSFLYHQVRNMVGSLVHVGLGVWTPDTFRRAFAAADRTQGGPTAPPHGLTFVRVTYPDQRASEETRAER